MIYCQHEYQFVRVTFLIFSSAWRSHSPIQLKYYERDNKCYLVAIIFDGEKYLLEILTSSSKLYYVKIKFFITDLPFVNQ